MKVQGSPYLLTFGTCGLNSTALCIASTAFISAVLSPRFVAVSGENLNISQGIPFKQEATSLSMTGFEADN